MKWCLLLLTSLFLSIVADKNLSKQPCFRINKHSNYRNSRIVGGQSVPNRWDTPYMAALTRSGNVFCGSSIISEKILILAAHCVCSSQNKIMQPTQFKVYIGVNKISDINKLNDGSQQVIVDKIIAHPNYSCGKKSDSDIALLQLKEAIKFNENLQPLCLSTDDDNLSKLGIVSGWGFTDENYEVAVKPDTLQSASVPVWSNEECQKSYDDLNKNIAITNKRVCAGGRKGGLDSCYSDSGGPLVDSKVGSLIGIVSNGIGCGRAGLPGIYTRVSQYVDWIQEHVAQA